MQSDTAAGDTDASTPEVSVGDIIAFEAWHDDHERHENPDGVAGKAMVISPSGTIRVRGIGLVDVEPEDVIEIVERADG